MIRDRAMEGDRGEGTGTTAPAAIMGHESSGKASMGVARRIAAVARATPEAIALRAGTARLSYAALDGRANRLANHLRSLGVGHEVPVAICLERSFERTVAKLAVLKAGGAFVPLDPAGPEPRLRFVLHDVAAPVLIGNAGQATALAHDDRTTIVLEQSAAAIAGCPATDPACEPDAAALAYI